MADDEVTLAVAIRAILMAQPGRQATYHYLAAEYRRRHPYQWPSDLRYPSAHQIRVEAGKHEDIFRRLGNGLVELIEVADE